LLSQITEEEFVYDCLNNDQLYHILRESSKKNFDSPSSTEDEDEDEVDAVDEEQEDEDLEIDENLKD